MTDKPRVLLTDKTAFQLAKKYIDAGDVDGFNKMFMPMTPQMLVLTEQSIKADERQKVLAELEGWLDELAKLNGGEVMWIKLYPPDLDGDHILLGNWFRAKLVEMKGKTV